MKKIRVWDQVPYLCRHAVARSTRITYVAREDEEPRKHLAVEPQCQQGCSLLLIELPKEEK